jgi:WD40 repeat protein
MGAPIPSAETEGLPEGFLAPGQILGDRYQIKSQLGRGGMGEVWRAFDLKLRVEVALKAMLPDLFKDEKRRDLLRREVRAAREVVSPNVCRIFDLIEVNGTELVSMEYVDGGTLLELLAERGPLDLKEAQDIASQFLAGLEAIHQAGLVHRDVKPENIMITRAGRVVLMDFGLARQEDSGAGTVAGTPAYMAPEQAAGLQVDARADVYSAGVVLAEMVSPSGIKDFESRQSVWEGIRQEPAKVPDSPWAPVLKKAVAKEPDQRHNSAHTLIRELEDVTLRVEGAEDLTPYPGLASFTEQDAEYFFGREAEIEQMWRRLEGTSRMLGLVGPSGAGKTSFVQAGLFPTANSRWSTAICKPGSNPQLGLGRAMARAMTGDGDVMDLLLRFDDPHVAVDVLSRWRRRSDRALLVVDQFEELFTQNSPDVQQRFTDLLERLVLEADVHVLLSMRDDFMIRCRDFETLQPTFADLTALPTLSGAALRRALTQPALQCGYRFEDDELVDEMLAEVEGERGALPLLAFAAARLWEKRDRETGLLTRQAYHDIGGVGGALARHAEATIDHIGHERLPIVRELFRNLVTSEGTRAVREWSDLLSVFDTADVGRAGVKPAPTKGPAVPHQNVGAGFIPARQTAEEVLRELIDARLLTSYEVREGDESPTRRVEIIHESLLANWPRLVRWQTQDADAVQLREQLRQAAKTWDNQGRSDDTLWTGAAYREFASWRERYQGGLTEVEETFADAMTSLATRRRRRRRLAVAAIIVTLLAGLAVVGTFWRRSVLEGRRAEAQKLIALGQLDIEENPSATVAYAIASLELSDTAEVRRLALEALWKGPTALVVNDDDVYPPRFSADGHWLVHSVVGPSSEVRIVRADGSTTLLESVHETRTIGVRQSPGSGVILTWDVHSVPSPQRIVLWSAPEGRRLAEVRYHGAVRLRGLSWNEGRVLLAIEENGQVSIDAVSFDGSRKRLGTIPFPLPIPQLWYTHTAMDSRTGQWFGAVVDNEVLVLEIGEHGLSEPRRLGRHEGRIVNVVFDPFGRYLATANQAGEIRLWDPTGATPPTILEGPSAVRYQLRASQDGSLLRAFFVEDERTKAWVWSVTDGEPRLLRRFDLGEQAPATWWTIDPARGQLARVGWDKKIRVWPFSAPADAEPLIAGRNESTQLWVPVFDPTGHWLATSSGSGLTLYPLARSYASVMRHNMRLVSEVVFGPGGRWLASCAFLDTVRIWPLDGEVPPAGRTLYGGDSADPTGPIDIAVSPDGEHILVGTHRNGDPLLSLDGGPRKVLTGFRDQTNGVAFSVDGRLAAGAGGEFAEDENVIRIWEVDSGTERTVLVPEADYHRETLQFTRDNHLLSSGMDGLRRWNLEAGESEVLYDGMVRDFSASGDGRRVLLVQVAAAQWKEAAGRAVALDLESGGVKPLGSHGSRVRSVAIDPTGTIAATGDLDGVIRVSPVTGEEPRLLLGHEAMIISLAFDPLGRWIASGAMDGTVRLWPMPDLSKPPLHTLPREELIAKLKTLTNLRVVRDEESATGWKLTHDPFPGWETVPTW